MKTALLTRPFVFITTACTFFLLSTGCAIGPKWHNTVSVPGPTASIAGKKVVVADFYQSKQQISATQNLDIRTIKESIYVHDISGEIASALRAEGINAEARRDMKPSALKSDEVLVTGAIMGQSYSRIGAPILITLLSGTIVGGVLPSPVPFIDGNEFIYYLEMIDDKGRILMQTGEQSLIGSYKSFSVWGSISANTMPKLMPLAKRKILSALTASLKNGK